MESKEVWPIEDFGPNDLSHFHLSISVSRDRELLHRRVMVKKCGFRLICKPLDNDLEVWLQNDQLLDPALLYEVSHEDSLMNTKEKSSNEIDDLQDNDTWTELEGLNMADFSIEKLRYSRIYPRCRNVLPGGEMPKGFVLVEDGTMSFMASQDFYDKFLELVLCVIFGVEDGNKEISFKIVPHVNGQRRNVLEGTLGSYDSDHLWIQCLKPNILWGLLQGAVDFSQFGENYLRFSLTVTLSGGTMTKLGYMLRCRRLEDDLKVCWKRIN
ncbi:hypothetical protein EUGRSUZ_H01842 [Eucalyptus grandis]|uniref:Uncharacterized protein n=2 Tax=Eucalyptus grandis TaxID=71139 RepID=A0ACC3JQX9_EUCGR|nr:hypothetical protein EUGRSUZ_H01842 [Eucalyptus grandis]